MVVFDATSLLLLLSTNVAPPRDPTTNDPISDARERMDYLVQRLEKDRTKIIIPTPALSEILVRAGTAGADYLTEIAGSAAFRIADFDTRAAVEVAVMTREALEQGDKRDGGDGTWAKIKYDRQIIAIAKTEGATVIYSDDKNIHTFGVNQGLSVIRLAELPLPPADPQATLELEPPTASNTNESEESE